MIDRSPHADGRRAQVKVCGVTTERDARLAVELGAAYLGLNFVAASPRCVAVETARRIADAVAGRAVLVGVFVDAPRRRVEEIAAAVGLGLVQFHGDETPEDLAPFGARALKALRGADRGALRFALAGGFLFDTPALAAAEPAARGGTGRSWDYTALAPIVALVAPRPVFVAGGIGPDNVRRALTESGASIVDVCSRVESAPGVKDPELLARLFSEVTHVQKQR